MSLEKVDRRFLLGALGGAAGVAALTKVARGGPLNPPAGPITSTGKTLQDIADKIARTDLGFAEPRVPVQSLPGSATAQYVISQPGSYYLTENIQGAAGKHGIEIVTDRVAIDMCGFSLIGTIGSLAGLFANGSQTLLSVRNGSADSWGQGGFQLRQCLRVFMQSLMSRNNGAGGFEVGRDNPNAQVTLVDCRAVNNVGGFSLGYEALLARCVASNNRFAGIHGAADLTVVDCAAHNNDAEGFNAGFALRAFNCRAKFNRSGFRAEVSGGLLAGCLADANSEAGIVVVGDSCVENCLVRDSAFGIRATGARNRVDSNNIAGGGVGIEVSGQGNLILRNSVSGAATAYTIAGGNAYGPLVNVAGVGAITGVANANHPWANFIY